MVCMMASMAVCLVRVRSSGLVLALLEELLDCKEQLDAIAVGKVRWVQVHVLKIPSS